MKYKKIKLKEVCTVNQGLQIPISKRFKEAGNNRYFYITIQFLKGNSENYYIENPKKSVICNKEDILVVRTGSTGVVLTGVEGCFHNNFFKVVPKNNIFNKYLYYSLNNKEMYEKMLNAASGTTIPDLKHSSFYELEIPLPEYCEQVKIAKILNIIDKKIELNTHTNNNLPGVEFDVKLEENSKVVCHIICIFDDYDEDSICKIQSKIEEVKKLEDEEDYYTLNEFETILYNIGVSVLLIAHQKSDLDIKNSSQNHHSLSEAVENPREWIKTGFINALEYQKPRVQGMIKNNLREMKSKFATITGSDCHVWSAYPNKDDKIKEEKEYLTTIKCLPTFKGLVLSLTSPDTRFERNDEGNNSNYINEIKLGDKSYELSTGINAIIGENGAGKSYILGKLNGEEDRKYKKINDINKVKISKVGSPSITKISQGEIIEKVKSGNLLDNDSEFYDEISTINEFKTNITSFVSNLKKYVEERIKKRENQDKVNSLKIQIKEFKEIKNYYISLNTDVETIENNPKDRYTEINNIYTKLYNEYKSNSNFYTEEKEIAINKILTSLQDLRKIIAKERDEISQKNKTINVIIGVFNEINTKIKADRTSQENENEDMITEIRDFALKIKNYIINKDKEMEFPNFPKAIEGTSVKAKYGFRFIKEAKYNNANLEKNLYKDLFVQNYQSKEKIMNINNKDEFANAVKGSSTYEMVENSLNSNVQKFIAEYTREETSIKDENGTDEIGTTPGEIALTYYKLQLSKEIDGDVILIDQPEDDISMKRIENYMIDYFNSVRDKKQVIFVTHNPLLVVNLDVDNVIDITKDRKNVLSIKAGCLEDDDLLEVVSESLDGGKEAVERRLKVYGTN